MHVGKLLSFFRAGAIFVHTEEICYNSCVALVDGCRSPWAFMIGSLSDRLTHWAALSRVVLGIGHTKMPCGSGGLLISSLLNVFYLLPVAVTAFFRSEDSEEGEESIKEAPWLCVAPLAFTWMLCAFLLVRCIT